MITLINHEDPIWRAAYLQHGRENGAATYSREICQFQIPVWEEEFPGLDLTISTCPLLHGEPGTARDRGLPGGELAVQYLHEWRFRQPQRAAVALNSSLRRFYSRVAFVVAYKGLQRILEAEGLTALYVPMSIDVQSVAQYRLENNAKRYSKSLAYFGNITRQKAQHYHELERTAPSAGWVFQKVGLRQPQAWEELARYQYGVGVGRCALEMAALGLKVLISGRSYGGLVMDHGDYLRQQSTNFNGRIVTGAATLRQGLQLLPQSMLWTPMDSREATEWLRTEIWEKIHGRRCLPLSAR
jgi:hypothetical protein